MNYIIIYDITEDKLRSVVSKKLESYGLDRVQYSCFRGNLTRSRLGSLKVDLEHIVNASKVDGVVSIIIYPLCNTCSINSIEIPNHKIENKSDVIVI